jgi:hypothetical protein
MYGHPVPGPKVLADKAKSDSESLLDIIHVTFIIYVGKGIAAYTSYLFSYRQKITTNVRMIT